MKKNPVGWFEIYVQDMKRSKKFYEQVLETELAPFSASSTGLEMCIFPMEKGAMGAAGALAKMEGAPSGGNSTIVYFMSDDCSAEEKRIPKAGGKIFKPKMSIGENGFIVLALDTEGNMFGIHSMK